MKILSLGASSSKNSINAQLALATAQQVEGAKVTAYALDQLELPIYSTDLEEEIGIPQAAKDFLNAIKDHDAVIISMAEHNGSYTAAFKNLYDWASRAEQKVWQDTPMLLLSTSPGPRGAATVLAASEATFPRMGANLAATFPLPSFYDNFADGKVTDEELATSLAESVKALISVVNRK